MNRNLYYLWIRGILMNRDFVSSSPITPKIANDAVSGDLGQLKRLLEMYKTYLNKPRPFNGVGVFAKSPEEAFQNLIDELPPFEPAAAVDEVIAMIDSGEFEIS